MDKLECSVCGCACEEPTSQCCPECDSCVCEECSTLYEGYCQDCFNESYNEFE